MSKTNENVLQLSILEQQYEALLLDYKQTYQQYLDALKGTSPQLKIASTSKYVGLPVLNQVVTADQNKCRDLCYATNLCNGANYDSVTTNCSLFSNAAFSPISPGNVSDFAIYSNIKDLNVKLNELNVKLVEINSKIFQLIKSSNTDYNKDRSNITSVSTNLENKSQILYDEKQNINNLLHEFETYIEKDVSTKTEANRKYMIYVLLFCILIFILMIFIKTIML